MNNEKSKLILLVEDDIIISKVQSKVISKFGYSIVTAGSGEEAVFCIKQNHEIDLVIMDIDLGDGIDGTEAAKQILKLKSLPIVFHTSHSEKEMVERVRGITRYGYVIKNSGNFVLQSSIEMAFELYEAHKKTQESEESLSTTLQSIGDAVIATDINGKIIRMNGIAEKMTAWTFNEARGQSLINIFRAINLKTRLPIENPVEVVLKEKKIVRISEHTALLSKDNREYLISDSAAPIKDKNGNIQGVILVFSDITDKYYAEEALKRSEERLQLTLECTNIGVWDWDIVHDKWYASPSFYSMLGYKAEVEASDKDIWNQRIHPEDRQLAKKVIKEALIGKEESYQYEARMLHRNGTYRWHNVFGYIIDRDSTGYATRLVGIRIDITEKKLSEISLKESEKFFTAIFEQAIVGVAEIDTDTGRFLNVNKKYADIVGYSVEEMLELDFLKITHPQDLEIDLQFMKQLKSNEIREFCMDKRYFHKDGGIRWVNLSVTPLWRLGQKPDKHIAIVQDITEKKLAEENIQNVQRTLSTLISNLQGLAYRCKNDKKWTMEFMSEGIKELSGYSAEDFVENKTLSYNDVIHPEDTEYVFNEVQKAVRNRKHFTLTYRIIDSSEREKWVLEKGLPIFSSEGDLLSIEGFITDITERKMAELEISRLLEEKEIILKEVHHRVKNNMMAIHSLLSIHANISDNPKTYEILQDAARRIHSMASLYDKLFHSSNFTDMSLQDYLKPLIYEITSTVSHSIELSIHTDFEEIIVQAKKLFSLGIVINEIITNSLKYAFTETKKGTLSISAQKKEKQVFITVIDDGKGFSITDSHKGFGMKLIGMLMKQLNGSFYIESNQGTRVYLEFQG